LWVTTNSFSDWTASGDNNPLPVTWLSFKGLRENNDVRLNWTVAQQVNNKGFAIERSEDGKAFIEVGFVNGQGTVNEKANFTYLDEFRPSAYYRLRQVDNDGQTSYSDQVFVPAVTMPIAVYPNPTHKEIFINGLNGEARLEIFNAQGKLVVTYYVWNNESIDIRNLPVGVYQYRIVNGEKVQNGQIVKE
jgi:hypothetical protein